LAPEKVETLKPSEAYLNATQEGGAFKKYVTEDGQVYFYDEEQNKSKWELEPKEVRVSRHSLRYSLIDTEGDENDFEYESDESLPS